MWSVGVVALEMLLGNPDVFEVPAHTRTAVLRSLAAATMRVQHATTGSERLTNTQALLLRGMLELCILPPQLDPGHVHGAVHALQWSCSDAALLRVLRGRDPTGQGPPGGRLGVRLLRALLAWAPEKRPTAGMALRHVLFAVPDEVLKQDVGCDEALALVGSSDGAYWC